ncbi:BrnA antitoxin family protein [Verticiella sediminum]|uniref:BrnA antitoxin family protein n=1 Tax=Verticiella sediminum TaxID=1247510 RepID=A0A556AZJ0_9BURK|nr:BrnA antitoxin family protein [Verticiella sediminum]TSH98336.1 BrnA antitoxin family protein [Verticiella sediminum]
MSSKRRLIVPTPEEDAAINAGIAADLDTYELGADEFKQLKRIGRPPKASPKVAVTIRYDQEVIDAFKAGGEGWQTRMNDALLKAVRQGAH